MVDEVANKKKAIEDLCRRYQTVRLDLFGSASSGSFEVGRSDFDFLVDFGPIERQGLNDVYFALLFALEKPFDAPVHLVEERSQDEEFLRIASRSRTSLYAA